MGTGNDKVLGTDRGAAAFLNKINDDMVELFANLEEVEAARDGESTLLDQINALQASIAALLAGSGIPISADDTTPGYANGKLVGDADILLTENNGGGNETLTFSLKSTGKIQEVTASAFYHAIAF